MSEAVEYDDVVPDYAEPESTPSVTPGSLEDRVATRRAELESTTTDLFDVPGFDGVLQVELQVVGAKRQHALAKKHERVRDEYQQTIRVAADCILAATVGFYGINDDGEPVSVETSWKRLAIKSSARRGKPLADDVDGRVALVSLLTDNGIVDLASDWKTWMRTRGQQVDTALERDF